MKHKQIKKHTPFRFWITLLLVYLLMSSGTLFAFPRSNSSTEFKPRINHKADAKPAVNKVYFEENIGQFDKKAKFHARSTKGYSLFLTATEAIYLIEDESKLIEKSASKNETTESFAVFMKLNNANKNTIISGLEKLKHKSNVFIGEQSNWKRGIENFGKVRMNNVYNGIDTLWHGKPDGKIQYDFIVKPFADPNKIEWLIEGADSVQIDKNGELLIKTEFGTLRQQKPFTYQTAKDGTKVEIESRFEMRGQNRIGFVIGDYDKGKTLIIDPTVTGGDPLEISSLIGGSGTESVNAIEIANDGKIYVAGGTNSPDFPLTAGVVRNDSNAFLSVFNEFGTDLVYSTIIGSDGIDVASDMKLDKSTGIAYLTGRTENISGGNVFPTTAGAFDATENGGSDAFLTLLNPNTNTLIYSSLIGGEFDDEAEAIEINGLENIYITGYTGIGQIIVNPFPTTPNAFDTTHNGDTDAFVAKFDLGQTPSNQLKYSTFIGGQSFDQPNDIAIDNSGNVFIAGITGNGGLFGGYPTTQNAYSTGYNGGDSDAFITKLNADGSGLIYSTFLGGSDSDLGAGIEIDQFGNAYVIGQTDFTTGTPFPTTSGAFDQTLNGSADAFVSKLNSTGTSLLASTILGGNMQDYGSAIELDGVGNVIAGGNAASQNFPITIGAYDAGIDGMSDIFLTRLDGNLSEVSYSTFIGGGSIEDVYDIDAVNTRKMFFGGTAFFDPGNPLVYPTTVSAFDNSPSGDSDGFATRFELPEAPVQPIANTKYDFDGDAKTDVSIFRPSLGEWWYLRSSDNDNFAVQFGASSDIIVPGDYTGDGKTDIAFFRPSNSEWFVLRSEDSSFYSFPFGASGDMPAPGDYDGDGITDAAVFRASTATWFINNSSGGVTITGFGVSGDKPVVADYDGDGKDDIGIYRPSNSQWWINRSNDGVIVFQFGSSGDRTVQGDWTGDGKADVAFWRPTSGEWFVLRSEDSSFFSFPFGANGDIPAPGDYDGDGQYDAAVFRPTSTTWFINGSTAGTQIVGFGVNGDIPVPNAYVYQ